MNSRKNYKLDVLHRHRHRSLNYKLKQLLHQIHFHFDAMQQSLGFCALVASHWPASHGSGFRKTFNRVSLTKIFCGKHVAAWHVAAYKEVKRTSLFAADEAARRLLAKFDDRGDGKNLKKFPEP